MAARASDIESGAPFLSVPNFGGALPVERRTPNSGLNAGAQLD